MKSGKVSPGVRIKPARLKIKQAELVGGKDPYIQYAAASEMSKEVPSYL